MAISVRSISHDDQVSVFAHLGELRVRLIVSVAALALALAFAFAFWQSHAFLQVLNRPLANAGSPSLTDSSAPLAREHRDPAETGRDAGQSAGRVCAPRRLRRPAHHRSLLASRDQSSVVDARDHAVLMPLARLGLRAIEVSRLQLLA